MCLTYDKKKLRKSTSIQWKFNHEDTYHCVFYIVLMSDGLAHCRLTRVVKIFEMIKQPFNVMFGVFIVLRIFMHNFAHAGAMDTAQFSFGHLQTFCYSKNRTLRENVVIAPAETIFIVYGKMFSSCVCNKVMDLLQFHETVLGYGVCKFIGYAISLDFASTGSWQV